MDKTDYDVFKKASATYDNPNSLTEALMSDHNAQVEQQVDRIENGDAHQPF